ncbi:MAG TPA: hypothetical protein VK718_01875 [Ferruginibacter sp.]|jgi:hypothetical protein|nr:hypothetical protein [Ferruginibacter sp.]
MDWYFTFIGLLINFIGALMMFFNIPATDGKMQKGLKMGILVLSFGFVLQLIGLIIGKYYISLP